MVDKLEFDAKRLDELIEGSFWRDILLEIISDLDPWDIDIVDLATKYSKKVSKMHNLNFKIPANVIIVSSVLLRMKADLIRFSGPALEYDLESWVGEGDFMGVFSPDDAGEGGPEGVGDLTNIDIDPRVPIQIKPKRVTKRRITALELISAIQEVLEDKEREKVKKIGKGLMGNERKDLIIKEGFDIKKLIEATYLQVMEILMRKNEAVFADLVKGNEDLIPIFLSLLHLSNSKRVKLSQKEIFGDILISVFSKNAVNSAKDNSIVPQP